MFTGLNKLFVVFDQRISQPVRCINDFFLLPKITIVTLLMVFNCVSSAQAIPTCNLTVPGNYTVQNPLPFLGSVNVNWSTSGASSVRFYGIGKNGTTEAPNGQVSPQELMYDQIYTVRAIGAGGQSTCSKNVPISMPSYLKVLGTGQSNMRVYLEKLDPPDTSLGGFTRAKYYFEDRMTTESSVLSQNTTFIPDYASGGSALLQENTSSNPQNYWVGIQNSTFIRGPLLDAAIARLDWERANRAPLYVNFLLWAQGEQDAQQIELRAITSSNFKQEIDADLSRYKEALKFLITELRAASGSIRIPMGIQALGKRVPSTSSSETHYYAISRIQNIQQEVADEMFGVEILADAYDASLSDTVHMDREGQELVLDRLIDNISLLLNREATSLGPKIESATIESSQNSLILEVSNASTLNVGFDLKRLFKLLEHDGTRMSSMPAPVSIEVLNSQEIRVNFDYDLNIDNELGVAYGPIIDLGTTNVNQFDNGWYLTNEDNLPVRPGVLPLKAYGEVTAINFKNDQLEGHVIVLEDSFNPITRNEIFKINGVTYEVNNASMVGNLYLGDQVISGLNIGDGVVRLNSVAPPNESHINKIFIHNGRLAIQTAKSATIHKNLSFGQQVTINGTQYQTLSGSMVGSIYLDQSLMGNFALGDKVYY